MRTTAESSPTQPPESLTDSRFRAESGPGAAIAEAHQYRSLWQSEQVAKGAGNDLRLTHFRPASTDTPISGEGNITGNVTYKTPYSLSQQLLTAKIALIPITLYCSFEH